MPAWSENISCILNLDEKKLIISLHFKVQYSVVSNCHLEKNYTGLQIRTSIKHPNIYYV